MVPPGFNFTEPIFGTLKPFVRGAVVVDVKSGNRPVPPGCRAEELPFYRKAFAPSIARFGCEIPSWN
jgi:hypothetical protein